MRTLGEGFARFLEMKKLLGIVVLGLLLCLKSSQVFAETKVPEWYINIPETNNNIYYSKGEGLSKDMVQSNTLAFQNALINLCEKIKINKENFVCKFSKYEKENLSIAVTGDGKFKTFVVLKYKLLNE